MCNPTKTIQQPSWLSQPQQKGRTQHILHFQRRHCAKRLRQRVVCPLLNLNHSKVREITNSSVLKSEFIFFCGAPRKAQLVSQPRAPLKKTHCPPSKAKPFFCCFLQTEHASTGLVIRFSSLETNFPQKRVNSSCQRFHVFLTSFNHLGSFCAQLSH